MATDVYAFGMLLYEVLFRREPFADESSEVITRRCMHSHSAETHKHSIMLQLLTLQTCCFTVLFDSCCRAEVQSVKSCCGLTLLMLLPLLHDQPVHGAM